MVLEKILESPLYNKEIKTVNLKGSQPLTPAVLAEASTEGLKVERTDASTAEVPNHGSSKQIIWSSTPGGSSERLLRNVNVYLGPPTHVPPALEAKEGVFWALEVGDGSGIHWGHHLRSRTGKDRADICGRVLVTGVWEQEGTSSA